MVEYFNTPANVSKLHVASSLKHSEEGKGDCSKTKRPLWQGSPSAARMSNLFALVWPVCCGFLLHPLPPRCVYVSFRLNYLAKTCFSMSTHLFPDGTKRNFKRHNENLLDPSWPGGGGGFPGFQSLSPALIFLASLQGHVPRRGRTERFVTSGQGDGSRAGLGAGAAQISQGHPWGAAPCVTWDPPCDGVLQAPGSRRGAGFPRL